jgi:hypothetical protein
MMMMMMNSHQKPIKMHEIMGKSLEIHWEIDIISDDDDDDDEEDDDNGITYDR